MRHDGAGSSAVGSPEGMRGGTEKYESRRRGITTGRKVPGTKEAELLVLFPPGEPGRATYHFPHINTVLNTFTHLMPLNIL